MLSRLVPLLVIVALSACNLPRGAAMQGEIVAGMNDAERDFQVVSVSRDNIEAIKHWALPPQAHLQHGNWPRGAQRGPASVTISPGDRVDVTIFDNEENSLLTSTGQKSVSIPGLIIANNGTVHLPYVGSVHLAGLSPDAARARIEDKLVETLPSGQVVLQSTQGRQNTVDLVSGVASPGSIPLPDRSFSILSLISQGGGVKAGLENPIVKLVRGGKTYSISLARLFGDAALDVALRGGDKVIIESDPRYFLALGASGKQNTIPFNQDRLTALDAITLIGGVQAARANAQGVLILREYADKQVRVDGSGPDRKRVIFTLDLTSADGLFSARHFTIANGDLVLATESPLNNARTLLGMIGQVLGLASRLDGG